MLLERIFRRQQRCEPPRPAASMYCRYSGIRGNIKVKVRLWAAATTSAYSSATSSEIESPVQRLASPKWLARNGPVNGDSASTILLIDLSGSHFKKIHAQRSFPLLAETDATKPEKPTRSTRTSSSLPRFDPAFRFLVKPLRDTWQ